MTMKLITEEIESVEIITEEKNGKQTLYIQGPFLQAEVTNRNGRCYPMEVLAREVIKYNESFIKQGRALGELGHPDGPTVNLDRVSHMITALNLKVIPLLVRQKSLILQWVTLQNHFLEKG